MRTGAKSRPASTHSGHPRRLPDSTVAYTSATSSQQQNYSRRPSPEAYRLQVSGRVKLRTWRILARFCRPSPPSQQTAVCWRATSRLRTRLVILAFVFDDRNRTLGCGAGRERGQYHERISLLPEYEVAPIGSSICRDCELTVRSKLFVSGSSTKRLMIPRKAQPATDWRGQNASRVAPLRK